MWITFLVSLAGHGPALDDPGPFELTAKSASGQLTRLRRALDAPAPGAAASPSRIAPELS